MPALNYDYDYYEYRNGKRANSVSMQPEVALTKNASQNRKTTNANTVAPKKKTTTSNSTAQKTAVTKKSTNKVSTNRVAKKVTTSKNKKNTNVAKKSSIDIPLTSSKKIKNKPAEMTLKKPKIKTKSKSSIGVTLKNIALVSVFFALFFMVCYRYSVINEEFSEVNTLKNELVKLQNANEQVQADIESKTDLTYVENYAKYQLGMQKPSSSQIEYVNVEKQDKITTPVTISEDVELTWFEKVVNEVRKIID